MDQNPESLSPQQVDPPQPIPRKKQPLFAIAYWALAVLLLIITIVVIIQVTAPPPLSGSDLSEGGSARAAGVGGVEPSVGKVGWSERW